MDQLPNEILAYILAHLPILDIIDARLVSKLWLKLATRALKGKKGEVYHTSCNVDLLTEVDELTIYFPEEIDHIMLYKLAEIRLIIVDACNCSNGRGGHYLPKNAKWGKVELCRDCLPAAGP
jgi:F-box domain